jgi:hypothetical protein
MSGLLKLCLGCGVSMDDEELAELGMPWHQCPFDDEDREERRELPTLPPPAGDQ